MAALMKSGDVVYTEDVDGIENAPDAFIGMMQGGKLGALSFVSARSTLG